MKQWLSGLRLTGLELIRLGLTGLIAAGLMAVSAHAQSPSSSSAAPVVASGAEPSLTAGRQVLGKAVLLPAPRTSEVDRRGYRALQLANGLELLLISDPDADKAAAALDVAVGAGSDPVERPGLAHFLEHMLFLGTAKYPEPDEYQRFISSHGGSHNAFTSLENTNYFFDIDPEQLAPALDRFAQFFIAPSFDAAYVEREKHAVHSEYMARINDDERRRLDVLRELFAPDNPAAKFSVGNLDTLAERVDRPLRDDLLAFYRQHYSAEQMRLVVIGRESLDALEQMVLPLFERVPVYTSPAPSAVSQQVFREGLLPAEVTIQSKRSERTLTLLFPLPSQRALWRDKPTDYVAYLLGHEGEGSLFQRLKQRGYAESLSAGLAMDTEHHALFALSVKLTEEGYRHRDSVVALGFEAIHLLRDKGIEAWRYHEQQALNDIAFRFAEKQSAIAYASALAGALQRYPSEDVLRSGVLMERFDEAEIAAVLASLRPDNVLLLVSAPEAQQQQRSHYYQTAYRVRSLGADETRHWQRGSLFSDISLPEKNPFIPQSLKIKPAPILAFGKKTSAPKQIVERPSFNVWFMKDEQFRVPRGAVMVYVKSERAASSVRDGVLSELFVRLLNDHLNSKLYTAQLAGLDFSISKRARGIAFDLNGYNEKQGLLLRSVMETFRNPVFDEERFKLIKKQWEDELNNQARRAPYLQMSRALPVVLAQGYWPRQRQLEELARTSLKEVQLFVLEFNRSLAVDMLVYGNFYKADADNLARVVSSALGLHALKPAAPGMDVVKLQPHAQPLGFVDALPHDDASLLNYYQADGDGSTEQAEFMVLAQLLQAAYFQALRTEQQLGYVVSASYLPLARVPGLALLVQSPSHSVAEIHLRSRQFLAEFHTWLQQQDEAWFATQRQAVLTQLRERPVNQVEQAMDYWGDMSLGYRQFDSSLQQQQAVERLDKARLLALYQQVLLANERRELLIASGGAKGLDGLEAQWQPLGQSVVFKRKQPQYHLP